MIVRRFVSLFLLVGGVIAMAACSTDTLVEQPSKKIETQRSSDITELEYIDNSEMTITVSYNDFSELEKNADFVLIARALKPFKERKPEEIYQDIQEDNSKILIDGYTDTEIVIKSVLKQPKQESKVKGDTMFIQEPAFIFEDDGIKKVRTIENYRPINDTDDYILFLNKSGWEDGSYTSMNWNNGRFSLQQSDELEKVLANARNLEQSVIKEQVDHHQSMQKLVFEKYSNEIDEVLKEE